MKSRALSLLSLESQNRQKKSSFVKKRAFVILEISASQHLANRNGFHLFLSLSFPHFKGFHLPFFLGWGRRFWLPVSRDLSVSKSLRDGVWEHASIAPKAQSLDSYHLWAN
jgi:hypothetical protein